MKKQLVIALTTGLLSLGSGLVNASDDAISQDLNLMGINTENTASLTPEELANTRGEAIVTWKKQCLFWKVCSFYPTFEYKRITVKDSRTGQSYTYTRNH